MTEGGRLFCPFGCVRIGCRHFHSGTCGEFFHGLHERQSALIGHPPNRVSVRSAAEAVIKALFVVDGEAGRFLIMKGATRLVLEPGLLDFDRSEEHTSELQSPMRTSYTVF